VALPRRRQSSGYPLLSFQDVMSRGLSFGGRLTIDSKRLSGRCAGCFAPSSSSGVAGLRPPGGRIPRSVSCDNHFINSNFLCGGSTCASIFNRTTEEQKRWYRTGVQNLFRVRGFLVEREEKWRFRRLAPGEPAPNLAPRKTPGRGTHRANPLHSRQLMTASRTDFWSIRNRRGRPNWPPR
jgi:hypothetical protein